MMFMLIFIKICDPKKIIIILMKFEITTIHPPPSAGIKKDHPWDGLFDEKLILELIPN